MSSKFYGYVKREGENKASLRKNIGGIVTQAWSTSEATASDGDVLGTFDLTDSDTVNNVVENNPSCARCLTVNGSDADMLGGVTVHGTNVYDEVISETFTLNGATAVTGTKAFKTVTSIDLPDYTTDGDQILLGVSDKLGLNHCTKTPYIIGAYFGTTKENTNPTITADEDEVEKNVIDFNSSLNGTACDVTYIVR